MKTIRKHIPAAMLDGGRHVLFVWGFIVGAIGVVALYGLPLWALLYLIFWGLA